MSSSSPNSFQHDDSLSRSTALKGATLAFQKTLATRSKPKPPTRSPRNKGALVAAATVTRGPPVMTPSGTGYSIKERGSPTRSPSRHAIPQQGSLETHGLGDGMLQCTSSRPNFSPKSPSYIAATLATSRTASPTPSGSVPIQFLKSSGRQLQKTNLGNQNLISETCDIQQTAALITMFEKKGPSVDPKKRENSPLFPVSHTLNLLESSAGNRQVADTSTDYTANPDPSVKGPVISPTSFNNVKQTSFTLLPGNLGQENASIRQIPEGFSDKTGPEAGSQRQNPQIEPLHSNGILHQSILPDTKGSATNNLVGRRLSKNSTSSDDTFISASSTRSPPKEDSVYHNMGNAYSSPSYRPCMESLLPKKSPSLRSTTPMKDEKQRSSIRANISGPTPHFTPSPPNAIVASSLASTYTMQTPSIAPHSPVSQVPPQRHGQCTPPSIHQRHHHNCEPNKSLSFRSAKNSVASMHVTSISTQRIIPRTLRTDRMGEKNREEERIRKKKAKGSKRHAYQEGMRRRWRDEITIAERKRYEGLWASNKGLLMDYLPSLTSGPRFTEVDRHERKLAVLSTHLASSGYIQEGVRNPSTDSPGDFVLNIIVRDLWRRSRLPDDELAEVWDLVDQTGRGMLTRHEFVIGLWVIDQRLKGRKIPTRIQESVWDSARGVIIRKK